MTGEQRRLRILFAILGVLAIVFVGRLVLGGGGDDGGSRPTTASTSVPGTTTAVPGTGADAAAGPDAPAGPDATDPADPFGPTDEFPVYATKNPFEPVIGLVPTGPPDTTPGTTPGTTPETTPSTTPGTTPGSTEPPSFEPPRGSAVALLDVFDDASGTTMARVQVGGNVYTVGVGDVFATSYQVVSLDGRCGEFLYGDSMFSLCEGEQVIK